MISQAFKKDNPLFIPFIMAGYPTLQVSAQAILALEEAGADIIELGVPFSDPVADGPINQCAAEIALSQGVSLDSVLNMIKEIRLQGRQTPLILFSYLNPILAYGLEQFTIRAKEVGVNGVLIVDLPPEEGQKIYTDLKQAGLEIVLLASPTTDPKRFDLYKILEPSFLYYISRLAVTGIQSTLDENLEAAIKKTRAYFPETPIAIGFGISNTEQAAQVSRLADGVIMGSLLVKTLGEQGLETFQKLAFQLAQTIHESIRYD